MRLLALLFSLITEDPALAALDDQRGCGFPQSPQQLAEQYCRKFDLHDLVRNEPKAREAKEECLKFYKHAAESINLMCSYRLESQILQGEFQRSAEAAEAQQRELMGTAQEVLGRAQSLQQEYLRQLEAKYNEFERRDRAYHDKLRDLAGIAGRTFVNESVCLTPPSEAPSLPLMGLATIGHVDRRQTFEALQRSMNEQAHAVDQAVRENRVMSARVNANGSNLGDALPQERTEIPTRDQGDPGRARRNPGGLVQAVGTRMLFTTGNRMVTAPLVRAYFPADPNTMGAAYQAAAARMAGMEVAWTYRLWKKGQLDWLDITSVGLSVFSGTTAQRGAVVAVLAASAEWVIRRAQYDAYVGRLYAQFAKQQLDGPMRQAGSRQLSRAFTQQTAGRHKQSEQCLAGGQ